MKKTQIAFFDTKPYDRQFFDIANQKHNFIIHYLQSLLQVISIINLAQSYLGQ